MIPVNHTYPFLGHFNVFSYVSPFIFWVWFYIANDQPNAERTQRLFASLREELEKRGTKFATSGD